MNDNNHRAREKALSSSMIIMHTNQQYANIDDMITIVKYST